MICFGNSRIARLAMGVLAAVLLFACVSPNIPPPLSFSKFVRDPGEGRTSGKVSFSTGAAIAGMEEKNVDLPPGEETEFTSYLFFFPAEGALSLWLTEVYDLTFSVGAPFVMGLEGNLSFALSDRFRIGLLHGLGLAFMGDFKGYEGDWSGALYPDVSVGLFLQISPGSAGAAFLGFKYTYGMYEQLGGPDDRPDDVSQTHYLSGSIGYAFLTGRLRITPEFVMTYGDWHWEYKGSEYGSDNDADLWAFVLSLTFAAAY